MGTNANETQSPIKISYSISEEFLYLQNGKLSPNVKKVRLQ